MSKLGEPKAKIRSVNEAMLYRYKAAFNIVLEYMHRGLNLNSCTLEEHDINVSNVSLKWFQFYISKSIDEVEENQIGTQNKFDTW